MPRIEVPIRDIIADPDHPADLSALAADEILARLETLYSFLPSIEDISIADDTAIVRIPEENRYREEEALRTYKRASRAAERGNYRAAVEMFQEVLGVIPYHAATRRDLAMAYMELGDREGAKQHVVEALRLEPDDAWSYVVLSNVLSRMEGKDDLAERYYQKAYELAPTDVYVLNGLGALKAKRGKYEEARSIFEQAIEQDPNHPNPRYGLALCYVREGDVQKAVPILEEMFSPPYSRDMRSAPVYEQARALYLEVNRQLAQQNHAEMLDRLKQAMDDFAAESGTAIELQEDSGIDLFATSQLAWVYGRDKHIIRYQATSPEVLPYRIGQQFEHIRVAHHARESGRARVLASSPSNKEYALRIVRKDTEGLRRQGLSGSALDGYLEQLVDGLLRQLYNTPMELFVEYRLYHDYAYLRPSQVTALYLTHQQNVRALTDESIQATSPRIIYDANIAMNCAYALFTDWLLNNVTAYAEPYRTSRIYSTGRRLFELWQGRMTSFEPEDEYELVDEFAEVLKLQRWYEWRAAEDAQVSAELEAAPTREGPTNEELLRQKEPATALYLLDALERFDGMDQSQIQEVAFEIATLGRSGLDYAATETKYTLRSLPGEQFSGLHLMALMYAGFKRIDPSVDVGMPFDEAYATALAMHRSKE
jgi:Flp pilus assembly protein TadD